jgi:hypothetical protein
MTSTKHRRSGRSRQPAAYDDTVSCPPSLDTRKKSRTERFEPDVILKTVRDDDDDHSVTSEYSQYTQLTRYTQQLYSTARAHTGYGHVAAGIAIFLLLTVSHQWNVDREAAAAASIMEELEQAKQHQESANNMNLITSAWEKRTLTKQLDQPSLRGSVVAQNHALQNFAYKDGSSYQSLGSDVSSRVTSANGDDGASRKMVDQDLTTSILLKDVASQDNKVNEDFGQMAEKSGGVQDEKLIVLDEKPIDKKAEVPFTEETNPMNLVTKLEKTTEEAVVNDKASVASESKPEIKIVPKQQVKSVEPIKLSDSPPVSTARSEMAPAKDIIPEQPPQKTVPQSPLAEKNARPFEEAKPKDPVVGDGPKVISTPEPKQTEEKPIKEKDHSVAKPPGQAETKSAEVEGSPETASTGKPDDVAATPFQPIEEKSESSGQPQKSHAVEARIDKPAKEFGQILSKQPLVKDESKQVSPPSPKAAPTTAETTPQKVTEAVSVAVKKLPPIVEAKEVSNPMSKNQSPPVISAEVSTEVKAPEPISKVQQATPKMEQAAVKPIPPQKPAETNKEEEWVTKKDPCTTTFNTISADGARMVAFLKLPGCQDGNEATEGETAMA